VSDVGFEELKRKQAVMWGSGTCVEFLEQEYRAGGEIVHTREYPLVLGTRR
jgi:hypothetical protein